MLDKINIGTMPNLKSTVIKNFDYSYRFDFCVKTQIKETDVGCEKFDLVILQLSYDNKNLQIKRAVFDDALFEEMCNQYLPFINGVYITVTEENREARLTTSKMIDVKYINSIVTWDARSLISNSLGLVMKTQIIIFDIV